MERQNKKSVFKNLATVILAVSCICFLQVNSVVANMKAPPPTVTDVFIIGDRVVDIAYNLGVMPRAMSVRGSMWPMAKNLKTVSQILGCPSCISKNKDVVPDACKKFGVKRLIIERSSPYCLYKPELKPENFLKNIDTAGLTIEYVDFSNGIEQAVNRTAELLQCSEKAEDVIAKYKKQMKNAEELLSQKGAGKKVIIFNGTFQPSTGKSILRVEAPGGYADTFILDKLGCVNAGDVFKPADGKAAKGHYPVKKSKKGMVLSPLAEADPDVIVMIGDSFAVEQALARAIKDEPELAQVKAIKSMEVYTLPAYIDSSVLEYPDVLMKWTAALAN